MKPRLAATALIVAALTASSAVPAQSVAPASSAAPSVQFDAATIKPPDPNARSRRAGFYGSAGGRIFFGGTARMLVQIAFGLQDYQLTGGPEWIDPKGLGPDWFEINAVPPADSPSRNITIANAEPTAEQRKMLQNLLRERFGLQYHFETRDGEVYILTRSTKPLKFVTPAHPDSDPRAIVYMKSTGVDGEAFGNNATSDYFAIRLGRYLQLPVLNQTGITGSWDFHLDPVDPDNQDIPTAVFSVVDRLGLKIKRGRGPIQTLVIDHIDHPTTN